MSLLSRLAVQAARAYGILSSKAGVSASYLVVAGGGSGGVNGGGGGGAGGMLTSTATLSTLNTYSITVGAGGASVSSNISGNNGSNSVISGTGLTTVTSIGGGYGGGAASGVANIPGGTGGSGGGGNGGSTSASSGTSGQGNAGGYGGGSSRYPGGGGGGAGAAGTNGNGGTGAGGNGGNGSASSISGTSVTYAGGGGGGGDPGVSGSGGTGGGGAGVYSGTPNSGTANTGGGGGGQNTAGSTSGAGGSGIVIISYTSATPKFVGGTLTTSGGNQIHTFTSSGTLSPLTPVTASYLVVAGGGGAAGTGGGAAGGGGGGGAGGLLTSSTTFYSGATYVVTVGAGGAGGAASNNGTVGVSSSISGTGLTTLTAIGGGGGGAGTSGAGGNGGSGGGGNGSNSSSTLAGGTATSGQGYNGGNGSTNNDEGGGGGGAGAVGTAGVAGVSRGNGGIGATSSISGSSVYYAGGGGAGGNGSTTGGTGGTGGGGSSPASSEGVGSAGTTNLGGGGGGGLAITANFAGGAGGSGVVIISYAGSQVFNGGLVTSSGGNTIHTFNATGALTPLTNNLNNSLRFRSSASARLTRTPTIAGNQKTWTWSAWVKRGSISSTQTIFGAYPTDGFSFRFQSDDTIRIYDYTGAFNVDLRTTQVFRDSSAWYHLSLVMDTTQATAANRVKLYVNGNQVTAFGTATYPTQNANLLVNSVTAHDIGRDSYAGSYFDGYLTDINFIDGQALEPYYFGNNDAYGNWKPILYKGTYGTNGFYLTFGNTTSTTTLGYDTSGNSNNWTTNNISLTAGTTYDAMLDVPTNTSATVANYCVNNPVDTSPAGGVNAITISGANLNLAGASSDWAACRATIGVTSGKWYWECTRTGSSNLIFGIGLNSTTLVNAYSSTSYGYFSTGDKYSNNVSSAYGASFASGDVIGVAFDADAGTLTFYKNNTSQGTAFTGLTSGPYFPLNQLYTTGSTASINFGQRPFSYTPPSGFVALNTYNLPTPTILQGNLYMDATTYTGTEVNGTVIVNQGQFKPDLVWIKTRSTTAQHVLTDSVRGVTKQLFSSLTNAEQTSSTGITSLNSNGFTLGTNVNPTGSTNGGGNTLVGWQWQAGQGSSSSNTSGSITSTVSVNATAGFSVVTYTGNGTAGATVGHGLGVAPKMIINKSRSTSPTDWGVYHASNGNTGAVFLNLTSAFITNSGYWNNTSPTSSVFTLGLAGNFNQSGQTYVAYCWAEIAGFSKFGSYTGNGSTDGPFIYTGFRPKYVMIKRTDGAGAWYILDSTRNTYNVMNSYIEAQDPAAEGTFTFWDFLSNGFKLRQSASAINGSGQTLIYAAFAENPFKNSNAR